MGFECPRKDNESVRILCLYPKTVIMDAGWTKLSEVWSLENMEGPCFEENLDQRRELVCDLMEVMPLYHHQRGKKKWSTFLLEWKDVIHVFRLQDREDFCKDVLFFCLKGTARELASTLGTPESLQSVSLHDLLTKLTTLYESNVYMGVYFMTSLYEQL